MSQKKLRDGIVKALCAALLLLIAFPQFAQEQGLTWEEAFSGAGRAPRSRAPSTRLRPARLVLAGLLMAHGDSRAALEECQTATQLAPDDPEDRARCRELAQGDPP